MLALVFFPSETCVSGGICNFDFLLRKTALADGYIDKNEEKILRRLAIESGIEHEAYSTLVERTLSECLSLEERAYFGAMEAINWFIDESNSFIDDLRNALGIDSEQHDRLSTLTRAKLN